MGDVLKVFTFHVEYMKIKKWSNSSFRERNKISVVADDLEQATHRLKGIAVKHTLLSLAIRSVEFVEIDPVRANARSTESKFTDEQITYMAKRFLSWKLPEHFSPDNGITFSRGAQWHSEGRNSPGWPIGTNLFDRDQAEEMVRFLIEGLPSSSSN